MNGSKNEFGSAKVSRNTIHALNSICVHKYSVYQKKKTENFYILCLLLSAVTLF